MAPVFLNEVAEPLLFFDFHRKTRQRLFLLGLPSLEFLNLRGLTSARSSLFKPLFFSSLQGVGVVNPL